MKAETLNSEIARLFEEVAWLLAEQEANPFRIQAYRRAAETLRKLERPVADILQHEGVKGLRKLPGIGESLACAIQNVVLTGRLPLLDQLRGEADPVALLASVPGIGPVLAARLHHELGIDTLEELEAAAHDGRLAEVGIGGKRRAGIVDSLAMRLRSVRAEVRSPVAEDPSVAELLDVDREYREQVAAGNLPLIAPRRFNPQREAWLPVLHTQRGKRYYTVLFSNTARAHQLGKTRDWVVLYYDDGKGERQCTIITAQQGPLRGKRTVRGREEECEVYYRGEQQDPPRDSLLTQGHHS